jgi:putative oxidoreductase
MNSILNIILWAAQVVVCFVLIRSSFNKFRGAEKSVYIFTKIGFGSFERYLVALEELLASVLIVIPQTIVIGSIFALFTSISALLFHSTSLGLEVKKDKGRLFQLALLLLALSLLIFILRFQELAF